MKDYLGISRDFRRKNNAVVFFPKIEYRDRRPPRLARASLPRPAYPKALNNAPVGRAQVKENICKEGFIVDKSDSSLTRSDAYMLDLFARCGVKVLANERQKNFPRELFDVRMYALQL